MYSKHKCFNSIVETLKPSMHSTRNSSVNRGSLLANVSLTDLINNVLFEGMHKPEKKKKNYLKLIAKKIFSNYFVLNE